MIGRILSINLRLFDRVNVGDYQSYNMQQVSPMNISQAAFISMLFPSMSQNFHLILLSYWSNITMKILFLCTAHNSLSQRLYVALAKKHILSVELAISDTSMIDAVSLFRPDIVLCPFLTVAVPAEVYTKCLTLIVHPGPPGDAGPSSIDWLLIGDDGSELSHETLLKNQSFSESGRSHWAVTILQATKEFDAGPVWAFEQFSVQIDKPGVTKSSLYRGPVIRAALVAVSAALSRIQAKVGTYDLVQEKISSLLPLSSEFKQLSVTSQRTFAGGITRSRPLLRALDRDFDITKDTAKQISRKIRCADSQPGCLSSLLGPKLYLYGGIIDNQVQASSFAAGKIITCRDGAICVATSDGKGIWITHLRRMKRKQDKLMWPKVPAVSCLSSLDVWSMQELACDTSNNTKDSFPLTFALDFQEIRVEFEAVNGKRLAYLYFDFYNGAMSTDQCSRLVEAFDHILETDNIHAMVLMGGTNYFSNGIHLNVIEVSKDPPLETWRNINRINNIVFYLLHELPRRGITSVAAIRGNCAAGGVALAAACDRVIAGVDVVLNPSYRAIGLHGSEYHTLSYHGRCGTTKATSLLHGMLPLSACDAHSIGLIDHVLHASEGELDYAVRQHVATLSSGFATWKTGVDLSLTALQSAQAIELAEMAKDCWSPRAERFHVRRNAFVRKIKPAATPLRFAAHRRQRGDTVLLDQEEMEEFDSVEFFHLNARRQEAANVWRAALHYFMTHIRGVFDKALQNKVDSDVAVVEKQQSQMIFPCYYQS